MELEDGGEIGEVGGLADLCDGFEGFLVVGEVGEVDDGEFVCGELNDEVGEAAGAAGVEEEQGWAEVLEPTGGVEAPRITGDGQAQALDGRGEADELVLPEGVVPFCIIYKGRVDAAIALCGAGDALVVGVAHGAAGDMGAGVIDRAAVHMEGSENMFFDVFRIGFMRCVFDDEGQEAEA